MQRSFNNTAPFYEDVYLKAEEFAFRQATAISVISTHVKTDLVSRGIDARQDSRQPERRGSRQLCARDAGREARASRRARIRRRRLRGRIHRHLRLVARDRRAGGGHSAHLRRNARA